MTSAIKLSLVSMLVLCLMFQHATAGYYCWIVCVRRCFWGHCWTVCARYCRSYYGKRSIQGPDENSKEIPVPTSFGEYDLNGDGGVTLDELAKALKVEEHAKGTEIAFQKADRNRDGKLNCEEFQDGPFLFNHRPTC